MKPNQLTLLIAILPLTISSCLAQSVVRIDHQSSPQTEPLVSRPPVADPAKVGFGFFSHAQSGARRDYIHTDDFQLDTPASITTLRWWGLFDGVTSDPDTNERSPAPDLNTIDNINAFTIRIHTANDDGSPSDAIVFEHTVPLSQCNPSPTGRRGTGENEAAPCPEYQFTLILPQSLTLEANRMYNLSIAAHLINPHAMNWQWSDCDTLDGVTHSFSYKRNRWIRTQDTDSAMELYGYNTQ